MPTIGLICSDEEDRRKLTLFAGESGHLVCAAGRLQEAVEILRERRPRAMLLVDSSDFDVETALREVLRVSPLLPVVVALKNRDASRAVALMKTGAAEVVAPPWTSENIRACLSKTLRFQGTAFSVVKPARRRSAPAYLLAVLVFFCAALGTLAVKREARLKKEELARRTYWDLPYRHPSTMAFDGKLLWIADWFAQSLYVHEPEELGIKRVVSFPAETPVAVAFTADAAWTVSAAGQIARRMKDAALTPLTVYKDSAPNTLGLAFDGLYLWSCDNRARKIYKRVIDESLTIVASFDYPGAAPSALAFDGKDLWSLDSANHELIRHSLERPDEALGRVPLPEYRDGHYRPVGLAWDGERFWTVAERLPKDSGPARLFRHAVILP